MENLYSFVIVDKTYLPSVMSFHWSSQILWIICVFLSFVFLMLSSLFIAALLPPAGKGLTSWLLFMMFIVFLLRSHVVYGSGVVLDCIIF